MVDLESRFLTVLGVRTHDCFSSSGAGGVPVVLVHGLAVSHRYLMPTARVLAERHPVLVPDLPGFGLSDKPPHAYDVGEHAVHLAAWLDARDQSNVCLAGHSFGAEVVARLAVLRPDLIAALVLAGPTSDPAARSRRGLVGRFAVDVFREQVWQAQVLAHDVADAKPWRIFATVGHSVRNAIEDDLRRLPVAPLVLGGERDPIVPLRWRAEVAAMTGGTEVTIPGAAHNVLSTAGRASADAIDAHLRRGTAPGR